MPLDKQQIDHIDSSTGAITFIHINQIQVEMFASKNMYME